MNAVPVTLIDIHLEAGAAFAPQLPASYNAFVVTIDGEVKAGVAGAPLATGSVGWTSPMGDGVSALTLRAGDRDARVLLYAGLPQRIDVVAQRPFIAGSKDELADYYAAYRHGKFPQAGTMRPVAQR